MQPEICRTDTAQLGSEVITGKNYIKFTHKSSLINTLLCFSCVNGSFFR